MKKLITALLTLSLVFLVGCGSEEDPPTPPDPETPATEKEK